MVHRSLAGSMERLFAHLIEVHAGAFPVWYAPVQLAVLPVGGRAGARRRPRSSARRSRPGCGPRSITTGRSGARIRAAAERKVPYVAVIGAREAAAAWWPCGCATGGSCRPCRRRGGDRR